MNIKRILSALESRLARHRKAAAGAAGALALLLILFFPLNLFSGTTVLVLVREDTTPETFARSLEKERVAAPSFLLEAAYSLARTGGVQPSSGYYALTGTDSLATFALKLRRSNLSQGIFRIPEGAPIWAVRALLEKRHYVPGEADPGEYRRTYQYLLRRGFQGSDIRKAMENCWNF